MLVANGRAKVGLGTLLSVLRGWHTDGKQEKLLQERIRVGITVHGSGQLYTYFYHLIVSDSLLFAVRCNNKPRRTHARPHSVLAPQGVFQDRHSSAPVLEQTNDAGPMQTKWGSATTLVLSCERW